MHRDREELRSDLLGELRRRRADRLLHRHLLHTAGRVSRCRLDRLLSRHAHGLRDGRSSFRCPDRGRGSLPGRGGALLDSRVPEPLQEGAPLRVSRFRRGPARHRAGLPGTAPRAHPVHGRGKHEGASARQSHRHRVGCHHLRGRRGGRALGEGAVPRARGPGAPLSPHGRQAPASRPHRPHDGGGNGRHHVHRVVPAPGGLVLGGARRLREDLPPQGGREAAPPHQPDFGAPPRRGLGPGVAHQCPAGLLVCPLRVVRAGRELRAVGHIPFIRLSLYTPSGGDGDAPGFC